MAGRNCQVVLVAAVVTPYSEVVPNLPDTVADVESSYES